MSGQLPISKINTHCQVNNTSMQPTRRSSNNTYDTQASPSHKHRRADATRMQHRCTDATRMPCFPTPYVAIPHGEKRKEQQALALSLDPRTTCLGGTSLSPRYVQSLSKIHIQFKVCVLRENRRKSPPKIVCQHTPGPPPFFVENSLTLSI